MEQPTKNTRKHAPMQQRAAARVAASAIIGPFSVVDDLVHLGERVVLDAHVVLLGNTTIGENTKIHSFACLGDAPQNKKSWQRSTTQIGQHCVIREHVTVHSGTLNATIVGNRTWLLAGSHVGHDSVLGCDVVVSNACQIAGHVRLGDFSNIGGMCGIQQFCVVGEGAMVGGGSMVDRHVPPYSLVVGNRAEFRGINIRGLKRRQVPHKQIACLLDASKRIYRSQGNVHDLAQQVLSELSSENPDEVVLAKRFAQFICDAGRVREDWCERRASMGVVNSH